MKKLVLAGWMCLSLSLGFVGCSDDEPVKLPEPEPTPTPTPTPGEDEEEPETKPVNGFYILNSGKMDSNNSSLAFYDLTTGEITKDVFKTANGKGLGDTANDMLLYGAKKYIAVSSSNVIYVLDNENKILKELQPKQNDQPEKPRHLTAAEGKVYVSLYSGYVACIDTTSLDIEKRVQVGSYPEDLVAVGKKLYVTNSGWGEENTVSLIDLDSFKETKRIEVVVNPTLIKADKAGNVYVISMGNYGDILNTLQKIDAETDAVTKLGNATLMDTDGDKLYLVYSQYGMPAPVCSTYDTTTGKEGGSFVTDDTVLSNLYSLSVNPVSGEIILGISDYTNTGSMLIFNSEGKLTKTIEDTFGINPMGAYFINN